MKYIIIGMIVGIVSVWGSAWVFYHWDKWVEIPALFTGIFGLTGGISLMAYGGSLSARNLPPKEQK